jgi:transcription elongation GreA/GreB family factor
MSRAFVKEDVEIPERPARRRSASVSVRTADGTLTRYRIVGVDGLRFDKEAVSWISPLGRTLLGAERGKTVVTGPDGPTVTIEKIEHR